MRIWKQNRKWACEVCRELEICYSEVQSTAKLLFYILTVVMRAFFGLRFGVTGFFRLTIVFKYSKTLKLNKRCESCATHRIWRSRKSAGCAKLCGLVLLMCGWSDMEEKKAERKIVKIRTLYNAQLRHFLWPEHTAGLLKAIFVPTCLALSQPLGLTHLSAFVL